MLCQFHSQSYILHVFVCLSVFTSDQYFCQKKLGSARLGACIITSLLCYHKRGWFFLISSHPLCRSFHEQQKMYSPPTSIVFPFKELCPQKKVFSNPITYLSVLVQFMKQTELYTVETLILVQRRSRSFKKLRLLLT